MTAETTTPPPPPPPGPPGGPPPHPLPPPARGHPRGPSRVCPFQTRCRTGKGHPREAPRLRCGGRGGFRGHGRASVWFFPSQDFEQVAVLYQFSVSVFRETSRSAALGAFRLSQA